MGLDESGCNGSWIGETDFCREIIFHLTHFLRVIPNFLFFPYSDYIIESFLQNFGLYNLSHIQTHETSYKWYECLFWLSYYPHKNHITILEMVWVINNDYDIIIAPKRKVRKKMWRKKEHRNCNEMENNARLFIVKWLPRL